MNFKKAITLVIAVSVVSVSCKKNNSESGLTDAVNRETMAPRIRKNIAPANLKTASFKVEGMTCAIGCAKTIQEELSGLNGVQHASVDFEKKVATVTFDKTLQNVTTLSKVIQATGDGKSYKVSNMKS